MQATVCVPARQLQSFPCSTFDTAPCTRRQPRKTRGFQQKTASKPLSTLLRRCPVISEVVPLAGQLEDGQYRSSVEAVSKTLSTLYRIKTLAFSVVFEEIEGQRRTSKGESPGAARCHGVSSPAASVFVFFDVRHCPVPLPETKGNTGLPAANGVEFSFDGASTLSGNLPGVTRAIRRENRAPAAPPAALRKQA
jgi:hypothetical protein